MLLWHVTCVRSCLFGAIPDQVMLFWFHFNRKSPTGCLKELFIMYPFKTTSCILIQLPIMHHSPDQPGPAHQAGPDALPLPHPALLQGGGPQPHPQHDRVSVCRDPDLAFIPYASACIFPLLSINTHALRCLAIAFVFRLYCFRNILNAPNIYGKMLTVTR